MKTEWGISGSALKWIAILLMAVDHVGASLLETYGLNLWGTSPFGDYFLRTGDWFERIYGLDRILRAIGRPAFPIFCFLLVEGFCHTHDVKKYALRLGVFALVSEIPFDLAIYGKFPSWRSQNVFFTLFLGLLFVWYARDLARTWGGRLMGALILCCAAELLQVDYGAFGVALIGLLYVLRDRRLLQCAAGAVSSAWEAPAPLAFVLLYFYNGKRGRGPKWFFYWFYPAHLFLYYLLGMWAIPAWIM
ncbi:MAG: TraX family protein [Eubacteriales bacterium]|nr:TraX family protein [Eubacteriales bacterium]